MRIGIFFIYIKGIVSSNNFNLMFLAKEIKVVFTRFSSLDCDASPQYKIIFELFFHQIKVSSAWFSPRFKTCSNLTIEIPDNTISCIFLNNPYQFRHIIKASV
jgi:hypothetical protein